MFRNKSLYMWLSSCSLVSADLSNVHLYTCRSHNKFSFTSHQSTKQSMPKRRNVTFFEMQDTNVPSDQASGIPDDAFHDLVSFRFFALN